MRTDASGFGWFFLFIGLQRMSSRLENGDGKDPPYKVDIWHNILWTPYKAFVFSQLHAISTAGVADFRFFQFAETNHIRRNMGGIDISLHRYPYTLLFSGNYDQVPKLALYARAFYHVWRSDADLVVLQGYGAPEFWVQALACKLRGRRLAIFCDATVNDNPQSPLKVALKRVFLGLCSGVLCYGRRSVSYIQSLGVPAERIWIRCQAAVLLAPGSSAEDALQARQAQAFDSKRPQFVFVGRLSGEKAVDVLLRAFKLFLDVLPGGVLELIGDGPDRGALVALTQELGLENSVKFTGVLLGEPLRQKYLAAHALVLPSLSEPWGLVVNEALGFGCPVIVSDRCGCLPELVEAGRTGVVIRAGDIDSLAEGMIGFMTGFQNLNQVAEDCVSQVAPYTSQRSAQQIYDACLGIIEGKPSPQVNVGASST